MTTIHRKPHHRRLDVGSLVLLLIGLTFGVLAYWLIAERHLNVLIIVPSIVATTIGFANLFKREAPRP